MKLCPSYEVLVLVALSPKSSEKFRKVRSFRALGVVKSHTSTRVTQRSTFHHVDKRLAKDAPLDRRRHRDRNRARVRSRPRPRVEGLVFVGSRNGTDVQARLERST